MSLALLTEHLKMVKMVNLMLSAFYHILKNLKILNEYIVS